MQDHRLKVCAPQGSEVEEHTVTLTGKVLCKGQGGARHAPPCWSTEPSSEVLRGGGGTSDAAQRVGSRVRCGVRGRSCARRTTSFAGLRGQRSVALVSALAGCASVPLATGACGNRAWGRSSHTLLRAFDDGDQMPLDCLRQRSLSEARIDTTSWRLSGLSGEATQNEFPSPRPLSSIPDSLAKMVAVSPIASFAFSLRIDMGAARCVGAHHVWCGVGLSPTHRGMATCYGADAAIL